MVEHNTQAERALLANALQYPDLLVEIDWDLPLSAFKSTQNRALMQTIIDLYNKGYRKFERDLVYNTLAINVPDRTDLSTLRHKQPF